MTTAPSVLRANMAQQKIPLRAWHVLPEITLKLVSVLVWFVRPVLTQP
jgi:hypothetical protein